MNNGNILALQCAGNLKTQLESGPVTADLTTIVMYLVINHLKALHPFTHSL